MDEGGDLDRTLLRVLLEEQIEKFRRSLEKENPGLSRTEQDRYLRAVRLFVGQLLGNLPRTRGRQARASKR